MKFRDPKTGEVFEDIGEAHSRFCGSAISGRRCDECPLYVGRTGRGCVSFRIAYPSEAARLMGLEVGEKEEPMEKTKKPLDEWTLGEVKRLCQEIQCSDDCEQCPVRQICDETPDNWELTPRFTEEEVMVLRHMASAGIISIQKESSTHLYWYGDKLSGGMVVPSGFLPSLCLDKIVCLEEILSR